MSTPTPTTPTMLYRIYISGDEYTLLSLLRAEFQAATVHPVQGLWQGDYEASCVIEVVLSGHKFDTDARIDAFAEKARAALSQDAVLVVTIPVESHLVTRHDTHTHTM